MINKSPPDPDRSQFLQELNAKAGQDLIRMKYERGDFQPRKAVYDLLPPGFKGSKVSPRRHASTKSNNAMQILSSRIGPRHAETLFNDEKEQSTIYESKDSLETKKCRAKIYHEFGCDHKLSGVQFHDDLSPGMQVKLYGKKRVTDLFQDVIQSPKLKVSLGTLKSRSKMT